jgi:hypothetical protein
MHQMSSSHPQDYIVESVIFIELILEKYFIFLAILNLIFMSGYNREEGSHNHRDR